MSRLSLSMARGLFPGIVINSLRKDLERKSEKHESNFERHSDSLYVRDISQK